MTQQPAELDPAQTLELACAAVIDRLAFPLGTLVPTKHTFGVVRVGTDLNDLVTEHGAVVHVQRAGGLTRTWQITARERVTVYAADYSDGWAAQDAVEARIGGRYRPNLAPGEVGIRIDSWRNESAATEQPYLGLFVLSSIWRVTTRHMPA